MTKRINRTLLREMRMMIIIQPTFLKRGTITLMTMRRSCMMRLMIKYRHSHHRLNNLRLPEGRDVQGESGK